MEFERLHGRPARDIRYYPVARRRQYPYFAGNPLYLPRLPLGHEIIVICAAVEKACNDGKIFFYVSVGFSDVFVPVCRGKVRLANLLSSHLKEMKSMAFMSAGESELFAGIKIGERLPCVSSCPILVRGRCHVNSL